MTVASNQSVAYDYRRFEDPEQPEYAETSGAVRPANRRALALRRAIVLVTALAAAAVCIGYLYVKAQVFKAQREVNQMNKRIETARKANSELGQQLNEATNVYTILEKAEKLGMGYPAANQVLYVSRTDGSVGIEIKK